MEGRIGTLFTGGKTKMLSIGELIDKLVIEEIKITIIREKLHCEELDNKKYTELNEKLILLHKNKGVLLKFLDNKIERVVMAKEKNVIFNTVKTY